MRFLRLLSAFMIGIVAARAHDAGLSIVDIKLRPGGFTVTTGFAPIDAQALAFQQGDGEQVWSVPEFESRRTRLVGVAAKLWEARVGAAVLPPTHGRVDAIGPDNVTFSVDYSVPPGGDGRVELRSVRLPELLDGHRQYATITDAAGNFVTRKMLDSTDPVFVFLATTSSVAAAPTETPTFWGFLKLGVEHIWTGYDHLLFLFGLVLVCRSLRSMVIVISCFTLAHSFTLALATLDLVSLSPRFVEPMIAASIVFVGGENLWRKGEEPKHRWALTFAFGLIHGFGFASVLRDLGVGANGGGLLMPLFTFNLGVEIGQVAVAAIVLPLLWQLRKNEKFARLAPPVLSALIALAGLYWFCERVFFA